MYTIQFQKVTGGFRKIVFVTDHDTNALNVVDIREVDDTISGMKFIASKDMYSANSRFHDDHKNVDFGRTTAYPSQSMKILQELAIQQ